MSYLVDHLEHHGYVERRDAPGDRRASLICLTERGWAQVRAALAVIADTEAEWTRILGKERMEQLSALLTDLNRHTKRQQR
jgi:DNA-binding MarR family transcriptional regulator